MHSKVYASSGNSETMAKTSKQSIVYPALGGIRDLGFARVGGPGLANMLLSWARALVAAERLGLAMIEPAWLSVKIGPLMRRERDNRTYAGLFRRDEQAVAGIAKLIALLRPYATVEKFTDPTLLFRPDRPTRFEPLPHVISPDYFTGLFDYHELITSRLVNIVSTQHVRRILEIPPADVAVHVRLGDFSEMLPGGPITANTRLPLSWFADRIARIRDTFGPSITFKVFSDGKPDQLSSLLKIDGVSLSSGDNAVVDMLSMARSRMLIASASTYSMWASFLGKMPSLWHPDGGLMQAFPSSDWIQIESAAGSALPIVFIDGFNAEQSSYLDARLEARSGRLA